MKRPRITSIKLTALERLALQGIHAREREITRALQSLDADTQAAMEEVAARRSLSSDAIVLGQTHRFDSSGTRLVPVVEVEQ